MLVTSIVLAVIVAVIDHFFGIAEPWRKFIIVGVVILFIIGLLQVLGLFPLIRL